MIYDISFLILGICCLLGGGELLVRSSITLTRHTRIPPLIIGLTVIAFGTSAPEMALNVIATLRGDSAIAFGNIIGSNIANIGLVLGIAACLKSLTVRNSVIIREIPMMILATLIVIISASDFFLTGEKTGSYDRIDGLVLLSLFCIFIYYTIIVAFKQNGNEIIKEKADHSVSSKFHELIFFKLFLAIIGVLILATGGWITVTSAKSLAQIFGVSETVIGLTIVAVGTSLPELITSIIAVRKGFVDLAIGNVVGSNIFNILFVLGTCATISTVTVPKNGYIDLIVAGILSTIILPFAITHKRKIVRLEGIVLLLLYFSYIAWRIFFGGVA